MSFLSFIAGFLFALVLGHYVVDWFLDWVRNKSGVLTKREGAGVPHEIVGLVERTLAFAVAFANVEGAYVVLITWMTAKLALNWKRPLPTDASPDRERRLRVYDASQERERREREYRVYGISALLAGTLSLGIGVIGGLIARCGL